MVTRLSDKSATSPKSSSSRRRILYRPGFWDTHIHGAQGFDAVADAYGPFSKLDELCRGLGSQGLAVFCPTLVTSPLPQWNSALLWWGAALRDWKQRHGAWSPRQWRAKYGGTLPAYPLGLHLEGPFLAPSRRGAHPEGALLSPSVKLLRCWATQNANHLAILTLAPELPGTSSICRWATREGIRVQVGHSAWSANSGLRFPQGIHGITHAFNAMAYHHRDPGLLNQLLSANAPPMSAELIVDGVHVHPFWIHTLRKAFPRQVYGVSDACSAWELHRPRSQQDRMDSFSLGPLRLKRTSVAALGRGGHRPVASLQQKQTSKIAKEKPTLAGAASGFLEALPYLAKNDPSFDGTTAYAEGLLSLFYGPRCPLLTERIHEDLARHPGLALPIQRDRLAIDIRTLKVELL